MSVIWGSREERGGEGHGVTRRNDAYGALDPRRGGCLV